MRRRLIVLVALLALAVSLMAGAQTPDPTLLVRNPRMFRRG